MSENRIGVVGIILESRGISSTVNEILRKHSDIIAGRMGIPYEKRGVSVISIIVDGTVEQISALTGKLGTINGVSVKSAISKK